MACPTRSEMPQVSRMTVHPTAIRLRPPRPRRSRLLVFVFVAVLLLLLLPSLVTFPAPA
jgi:hypothetical protein